MFVHFFKVIAMILVQNQFRCGGLLFITLRLYGYGVMELLYFCTQGQNISLHWREQNSQLILLASCIMHTNEIANFRRYSAEYGIARQ